MTSGGAMSESDGAEPPIRMVTIHGHRRAFRKAGKGPAVLLLHGIGMNSRSWLPVIGPLSERYTVIAPDLLGHGESDKPRADYSIAGYANAMRDLLAVLGIPRVTVVGHSLGGGIAMQFAYQFPEFTERLVLEAAGGLGRSVNPLIRLFTVPGSGPLLHGLTATPIRTPVSAAVLGLHHTGLPFTGDLKALTEVYADLAEPGARSAFLHVLRAAVDWRGQVITSLDRAYLAEHMPSMVIWGNNDLVLPVKHARAAAEVLPGSRLEVFPDAGHVPHEDDPEHFVEVLSDFIDTVPAASHNAGLWRQALMRGPRPRGAQSRPAEPRVVGHRRLHVVPDP